MFLTNSHWTPFGFFLHNDYRGIQSHDWCYVFQTQHIFNIRCFLCITSHGCVPSMQGHQTHYRSYFHGILICFTQIGSPNEFYRLYVACFKLHYCLRNCLNIVWLSNIVIIVERFCSSLAADLNQLWLSLVDVIGFSHSKLQSFLNLIFKKGRSHYWPHKWLHHLKQYIHLSGMLINS